MRLRWRRAPGRQTQILPVASGPAPPAEPLRVIGIAPTAGFSAENLRIDGSGFYWATTVSVGGVQAEIIQLTATIITVKAPLHAVGVADVVVTNPDGQSVTLPAGYTFELLTLVASPTRVRPGDQLTVSWIAPGRRSRFDWIALYKAGELNVNYDDALWRYTEGVGSGQFTFTAPAPGEYEFRYLLDDDYVDVGRSLRIIVQ